MSDEIEPYSPFAPRSQEKPPRIELARVLWTMTRPPNKVITAAIYVVETGRGLRIDNGGTPNLLDSLLSRTGDEPLEERAAVLREVLEGKGWVAIVPRSEDTAR